MSIPPLVCSTPPPPEQCEDDKDHEDFDLPYHLSQDDEEDSTEFSYSNYSTYDTYQTTTEGVDLKWPPNLIETTEKIDECSIKVDNSVNMAPVSLDHNNTSKVEDAIIEDLNLIVDKNIDTEDSDQSPKHEVNKDDNSESSDNDSRIKDQGGTSDAEQDSAPTLDSNESTSVSPYFNECDKEMNTQVCADIENIDTVGNEDDVAEKVVEDDQLAKTNSLSDVVECEKAELNATIDNVDDDFGDFEDFQFTNTETTQVLPISSENPWDERDCGSPTFVEFKANFDSNGTQSIDNNIFSKVEDLKIDDAEDDDFGDFDDFKSSEDKGTESISNQVVTSNVSVFDINSPDNELQICESITNLLTPIFAEEIVEPENEIVGKLESFLSETWGHLIDIDIRQPYMVNWNNSLGQKTLLKALCIDSRNILFGPKWHYNMPKYAANLSAAPLQPQKQAPSSTANTETSEKINKEANTWVDPFTQDGQESCNTENESNPEPAKRPTDLDVFGDASTQINKIYSSTIKVQPVRHINLPDTHIFTPTDSETPRSKKIHYDTESNSVPIPIENNKHEENLSSEPIEYENDYWEFQDFKAPSAEVPSNVVAQTTEIKADTQSPGNGLPNPGVTFQTQILQPIKMEPIIPTLNWPDPGEVKETFDDFSDFISNNTWNSDKGNVTVLDKKVDETPKEPKEEDSAKSECIDDDFETFQSAPATTVTNDFLDTFTTQQIFSPNVIPKAIADSNNKSILDENNDKKIENNAIKIENKSPSILKSSANDSMFKLIPNTNPVKHMNADILQPTNASTSGFNRSHQNSAQILQPLSLEGYSQINWPNPGIDLQDLSRFNPVDSVHTIKNDGSVSGNSKGSSPAHNVSVVHKEISDDVIWGDFVSSVPKPQQASPKKLPTYLDDDEWTDFVSSPSVKPINGLSTISLNVHTNLNIHKSNPTKMVRTNQIQLDIPQLNYITPKSNNRGIYTEKHFQNL